MFLLSPHIDVLAEKTINVQLWQQRRGNGVAFFSPTPISHVDALSEAPPPSGVHGGAELYHISQASLCKRPN